MYEDLVKRLRKYAEKHCPLDKASGICGCNAREAADAIEELSKQNEKWEEAVKTALDFIPAWIPVEERLPEVDLKVLTFARFKGDGSWFMDISSFSGVTNHGIPTFWGYGEEMVVTHWMPLPEPPKEENNED